MSWAYAERPEPGASLLERLREAVRPEFAVEVYFPDPDDPVLGGGRCAVVGCDRLVVAHGICVSHFDRWNKAGRPDLAPWEASTGPMAARAGLCKSQCYDLRALPAQLRLEVGYALQCRLDERRAGPNRPAATRAVKLLALSGACSVLERSSHGWLVLAQTQGWRDLACMAFVRYLHVHIEDLAAGTGPAAEYERDTWDARRLGIATRSSCHLIRFGSIEPAWLREATKTWARFRLATGRAVGTISQDALAVARFSSFFTRDAANIADESGLTRPVLERYLAWLACEQLGDQTRLGYLVSLRIFIDHSRRHHWLPRLPAGARLYQEDFPAHGEYLPRFIPEFVMAQLESDTNLAAIADDTTRHLIVVLMETGLRSSDACHLAIDAVIDDSVGWPCLRFYNSKVRTEQLVPLSPKAAIALRAQAAQVRDHWPAATRFLFPRHLANPDGNLPFSYNTLERRLRLWQAAIAVRDDTGRPYTATAHQFRHTLGTRMINQGIPEHIVQKLLGHKSAEMTARYAHLHDTTLRKAFDDYCQARVNIAGETLGFDADSPAAQAEWVKHRLARTQDSLPNGYCGRPPQQDCPHPNACLTCPDFQTTPEFLPVHRQQADNTRILIATADADGHFRLAANHRRVLESLECIIPALETLQHHAADEDSDDS